MALRIADLAAIDTEQESVFGGKALGLSRLTASGARVPEGFVVQVGTSGPEAWSDGDRAEFVRRTKALLRGGALAVRSSAVGEDSAERSFAGMFESVLGAVTIDAALAAAARCVASGGSERVLAYAGRREALPVGLVVQRLIEARCAGVCFTVDPSGRDKGVVIETVPGTGDRLVSGRADPERWRVYRSGLGGWEPRRETGRDQRRDTRPAVLAEDEAVTIAGQASAWAEKLGRPLDLEWAIDGRGLWWLQARPITASAPPREFVIERSFEGVDDGPVSVWANWNVREVMPDPFEPLEWTLWRDVILPAVAEPLFGVPQSSSLFRHVMAVDLVHGRVYWNMNALLAGPLARFFVRFLGVIDRQAAVVTRSLMTAGVLKPRRLPGSSAPLLLGIPGASLRSVGGILKGLRPREALRRLAECGEAIRRRPDVSRLGDAQLLDELTLLAKPVCDRLREGQQAGVLGFMFYALAERAFRDHPEARRLLASGIPGNPTTQISLGIDDLVEAARPLAETFREARAVPGLLARLETEPKGTAWVALLRAFLDRFGQRCPNEFDIGSPRWAEDPTMILDLVRAGLASPQGERLGARLARLARERQRAVEAAAAASPFWKRPLLRRLARLVELYMPLREAPKHHSMFVFQRMRQAALELGHRLVGRGAIDTREDVLFLEWGEIQALMSGERSQATALGLDEHRRKAISERRARFERFKAERPPSFLRSDGVPVEEADDEGADLPEGALRGVGASAGRASGPVRILREPDPRLMRDGDVIVMEFADPGWTPLFPRARGVVMEVGGVMCHAAVVSRELGIPAVFGVSDATRLLRDGQTVVVDGDLGAVLVEGPAATRPPS